MITIPIAIEEYAKECLVELLALDGSPIAEIHRGRLEAGLHEIRFDPSAPEGDGLDAGVYVIRATIDGRSETFPIQYMP